ncbi:MAG: polyprenyl synthetase family protein [Kofleriaceae bacterium]|jgi:octaprenyl-diphosphate synthase|nr:polyprenyl synthetase family protein [Kofleriaceae bacterium]MBP9170180.1 polyprenyl synthetase family protein [Kofleriaceae bacterium]MBP9859825.1 polyprenyl synthetase family protein [Kofleriaceae bacterium]
MTLATPALDRTPPRPPVAQLQGVCEARGPADLAARLADLDRWIGGELRDFDAELAVVPRGVTAVQAAAHHLLDLGGKHLRPMCVALAAKCGAGFGPTARQLAIAVELVHTATLLHDDVVDVADTRRGQPAARTIYGNATAIFAGDWLLVEALRRVRGAGDLGLLDEMLAIIEEMILAESIQLERRGQIDGDVADYYRVAEGKTAALFRWAMRAGARAGGCDDAAVAALEAFGRGLGVGFQIIDDCLDFGGVAEITGKSLYTDLREGKLTLPLLLALPRDRELVGLVAAAIADDSGAAGPANHAAIASRIAAAGGLAEARREAQRRIAAAIDALAILPDGPGKAALITVAEATATRDK